MKIFKNYCFTLAKGVVVIIVAAGFFASCSKDNSDAPTQPPSPVGFWMGKYGAGSTLGINYAMLFRADGSMRAFVLGVDNTDTALASSKGNGNWQQNGTSITTSYGFGTYQFTTNANANSSFTNMQGNWTSNTAFSGGFVLTKQ